MRRFIQELIPLKKLLVRTLVVIGGLLASGAMAGNWVKLDQAAPGGIGTMLLLSDGTVMAANFPAGSAFGAAWYRLTPDIHGSYVKGSWTTNASMAYTRLWYASAVLRDGRVFVAGAEYGTGWNRAEVYDPLKDAWTEIAVPFALLNQANVVNSTNSQNSAGFLDCGSVVLPNGNVLISPVSPAATGGTVIFNSVSNTVSAGPTLTNGNASTDEQSWVKLPDDSVLTFDGSLQSQRFIPSLNQWLPDKNLPVQLYDGFGRELGPGLLLPNGNAFFIGANGSTVLYTPSGNTSPGSWTIGPVITNALIITNVLGSPDGAAAMMVNGKILCALSPVPTASTNKYPSPTSFYEYDYTVGPVGAFTPVASALPGLGTTDNIPTWKTRMLDLPDGNVLYADGGSQLYVYQPDGPVLTAVKPSIISITQNSDASYHLVGTGLNGISQGAAYGDDVQVDSNYPLARVTDAAGNIFYLRTFNWSSSGVVTGTNRVSTEFTTGLAPGLYSFEVVVNGVASDPVPFFGPIWVQFGSPFPGNGTFASPYPTLALATSAVSSGGSIFIKSGSSPETITISKPMILVAVGGRASIGR